MTRTTQPNYKLRHFAMVSCIALSMALPAFGSAQISDLFEAYQAAEKQREAAKTPEDMRRVMKSFEALADEGHARSAFRLGSILYWGTLTEEDKERGTAYYRQAAEAGFEPAWRYLGHALLSNGQGEEALAAFEKALASGLDGFELTMAVAHVEGGFGKRSDPQSGVVQLEKLASAGDPKAAIALANIYASDDSDFTNVSRSFDLIQPLVENDEADNNALYRIAELSREAATTSDEMKLVISAYEDLAAAGHSRAAFRLGNIFYRGTLASVDRERAVTYYQKAGENGLPEGWRYLGIALSDLNRGEEALEAYEVASALGVEGFEISVAKGHLRDEFGTRSNPQVGHRLLDRLASTGDESAIIELAKLYSNSSSGFANFKRARALAHPFAENGDVNALMMIAGMHRSGQGGPRDYRAAADYYQRAIDAGESSAIPRAAEAEIRSGLFTKARQRLETAAAERKPGAVHALAEAHVRQELGSGSDGQLGRQMVLDGVLNSDLRFVVLALELWAENYKIDFDINTLIKKVENAANAGDPGAAAALLQFARAQPQLMAPALERRREYLDRFAKVLRSSVLAEETARLIVETNSHSKARSILRDKLRDADRYDYYDLLVGISRADRNIYLSLLQSELAKRGVYRGRNHGMLTSGTARAILRFCAQNGYKDECEHGPLGGTAVRLVSASLAMQQ